MKNGMLFLLLALPAQVLADDFTYQYLVLTDSKGKHVSVATSGLSMTVDDGSLVLANDEGTVTLSLATLTMMEFSETKVSDVTTGVSALPAAGAAIEVFDLRGVSKGTFSTVSQMRGSLPPGIYVVRHNGQSKKITLK